MSSTTFNISINGSDNGFQYGAKYTKLETQIDDVSYIQDTTNYSLPIQFVNTRTNIEQNGNVFSVIEEPSTESLSGVQMASLSILFPEWSIETFGWESPYYILEAKTYINSKEILLCRVLLNRNDAVAEEDVMVLSNERFYEKIDVKIPDPYWLCYDDEAETFRTDNCRWFNSTNPALQPSYTTSDKNDEGCVLFVKLIPVVCQGEAFYHNEKWSSGSNEVNLDEVENNALRIELNFNKATCLLESIIKFNNFYSDIWDYLNDTYPRMTFSQKIRYTYYIANSEGELMELPNDGVIDDSSTITSDMNLKDGTTWDSWRDGLVAFVTAEFLEEETNDTILTLQSNDVPITPLVFSYLLGQTIEIEIENLDTDMLNIVNKIQNNIIQVEKPDEYDAHIVTPVFIRSNPSAAIQIHPKVTEYITIRLDAYKSSVKKFTLKLEDSEFVEYARNNYGVVFRVVGSLLTQEAIETLYYILNEKGELVTTGNCKYIV